MRLTPSCILGIPFLLSCAGASSDAPSASQPVLDSSVSDVLPDAAVDDVARDAFSVFDVNLDANGSKKCEVTGDYAASIAKGVCSGVENTYERKGSSIRVSFAAGRGISLTEPSLDVLYSSTQPGFEGFFILAKERDTNHYYFHVGDDEFVQLSLGGAGCGITNPDCEHGDCVEGELGSLCRAFTTDFMVLIAERLLGAGVSFGPFLRMSAGKCASTNASAKSYSIRSASGGGGTLDFVFEDGTAFLDYQQWKYAVMPMQGTAEMAFDLCEDIPTPK